jgi:hypothetical protein
MGQGRDQRGVVRRSKSREYRLEAELAEAKMRVAALRADLVKGEATPAPERPASLVGKGIRSFLTTT